MKTLATEDIIEIKGNHFSFITCKTVSMTFLVGEKSAVLRQILIKVEHHKIEASWLRPTFLCIYNKLISHLSSPTSAHHTNIFSMFARLIGKLTHRTLAEPLDISIIGDIGDKIPSIIRGCHGTNGSNSKHDKEGKVPVRSSWLTRFVATK